MREPDKRDGNHTEETNHSVGDLYQNEGGVKEVLPSTVDFCLFTAYI